MIKKTELGVINQSPDHTGDNSRHDPGQNDYSPQKGSPGKRLVEEDG
ncbi:MAG: hypothetical protein PWP60_860 [Candidatus Atribacteria bacterium]|nr:hypothetical protein [Candidatus Atribacteria bacterium]